MLVCCSVERDRLREREKQARAQMSLGAERDLDHQDGGGAPLFGAPVKVSVVFFAHFVLGKYRASVRSVRHYEIVGTSNGGGM